MSNERKTQLSLLLLAAIMTIGLVSFLVRSVHKQFALYQHPISDNANLVASADSSASPANEEGSVLGASTVNPLHGIYVNPFPGTPSGAVTTSIDPGQAALLTSMAPQPTAPIQLYTRGYVYPIAELHNCNSAQSCVDYCDQLANIPLCAVFSAKQGFMDPQMVPGAIKLAAAFLGDSDFASCGTFSKCEAMCDDSSNSSVCGSLVSNYQITTRVLGAQTGTDSSASDSQNVSFANPYAHLSGDYSDPALNNYLAQNASSNCAPLDMICQNQQHPSGRVLSVSAPSEDISQENSGDSGNPNDVVPVVPTDTVTYNQCLSQSTSNIANVDPTLVTPVQQGSAQTGINNCTAAYQQNAASMIDSKKQEAVGSITRFQGCIGSSKNLSIDIPKCIKQDLGY